MRKIYFWDNGMRDALIGDFREPEFRSDMGALWENMMVTERIKRNHYLQQIRNSWFWRSLQQQEVDYVETENRNVSGYEMKYSGTKRNYVTRAFTNLYPKAQTMIVNPENFMEFCHLDI